jgi:HEAT repeat protein
MSEEQPKTTEQVVRSVGAVPAVNQRPATEPQAPAASVLPNRPAHSSTVPTVLCLLAGGVCLLGAGVSLAIVSWFSAEPSAEAPAKQAAVAPAQVKDTPLANGKGKVVSPKAAVGSAKKPESLASGPAAKGPPRDADGPTPVVEPPVDQGPPPDLALPQGKPATAPEKPPDAQMVKLLQELQSAAKPERMAAMKAIGNRGTAGKDAIPLLVDRLIRYPKEEADLAAKVLAQIGWPAVPELIKALDDPLPAVRQRALWALGIIGPDAKAALQAVCAFLDDKDAKMRLLAAQVLTEMGPQARPALAALVTALRDADPQVRLQAAVALHDLGPDTLDYLLAVMQEGDLAVRFSAMESLLLFHESPVAVQALVDALKEPVRKMRAAAAASLTRLGPSGKAALPGLLECLQESDFELQKQAFTAILAIGSAKDAKLLETLRELNATTCWAFPVVKQSAKERKDAVQRLVMALDDPDATRRLGAVLALGKLGPEAKETVGRLRKILQEDRNRTVLAAVLLALPAMDPKQKAPGKTAEMLMGDVWKDLKSASKVDVEELIQLYLLTSTLSCPPFLGERQDAKFQETLTKAGAWAAQAVDELPYSPWVLPVLVRGINVTAEFNLGFAEPFGRLSFKFQSLVADSKDPQPLAYALAHLGEGVPYGSPFQEAVKRNRIQVFTNSAFLEWIINVKAKEGLQLNADAQFLIQSAVAQYGVCLFGVCSFTHQIASRLKHGAAPKIVTALLEAQLVLKIKTQMELSKKQQQLFEDLRTASDTKLVALLGDPDPWVRWASAVLIARKRVSAELELLALLNDPVVEVREAAHQALVQLARGTDLGPFLGDSKAKIQQAVQRWNTWLESQEPAPSATPNPAMSPRRLGRSTGQPPLVEKSK